MVLMDLGSGPASSCPARSPASQPYVPRPTGRNAWSIRNGPRPGRWIQKR